MKHLLILAIVSFLLSCNTPLQERIYKEPHRPQFHFSPPANWMNDPNGMVYYKGEYHLFYQYYPDSTVWGPMHWGHAISKDLIHWEHLPVALYPDTLGYIFSGSAVVDNNNSSGFQTGSEPPLIALFTYDKNGFETQAIAYSNDNGRNWTKYEKQSCHQKSR
jgi:fructan beta-fructosidase